jgi:azurin
MNLENRNPDAPLKAFFSFWWGLAAFVGFGVLGLLAFTATGGANDAAYEKAASERQKKVDLAHAGQAAEFAKIAPDLEASVTFVAAVAEGKTEKPVPGTPAHAAMMEAQMAAAAAEEKSNADEKAAAEGATKEEGTTTAAGATKEEPKGEAPKEEEAVKIVLEPIPNVMKFKDTALEVPAGKNVELTFKNTDVLMHNFLLLKPGTRDKVGALADAMLADPQGMAKGYIPVSEDIITHTKLLMSGQSETVKFKLEAGEYPFICTFPGHWRIMQGTITAK